MVEKEKKCGTWLNTGYGLWQCSECGAEIITDEDCHPIYDMNLFCCYRCEADLHPSRHKRSSL